MVPTESLRVGILTGTTASGKTALALELAKKHSQIEIINADSLLVYRGMNIGTAKPSPHELNEIPHHLIDIRNPNETFTAADFYRAAHAAILDIHSRGKRALIVGGTGFYLKALLYGLWEAPPTQLAWRDSLTETSNAELYSELFKKDPDAAGKIGNQDRYRLIRALEIIQFGNKTPSELQKEQNQIPDARFKLWVLDRESVELHKRIHQRTQAMLDAGLLKETQQLYSQFPHSKALQSIGYRQTIDYLEQRKPEGRKVKPGLPGLLDEIDLATRQLVKQQRTWFRGQTEKAPTEWFILDSDRDKLEAEFQALYK